MNIGFDLDKIFNDMLFNFTDQQPHIFKDEVVGRIKIDRYVDDDLPLLEYLANRNSKTKFFWLNKNQSKQLYKNLFAINHLSEMLNNKF